MAIDFNPKDVLHRVIVKFRRAYLPDAKKPYNLTAVYQPELDIHGISSKAETYNITTPPKVIEEGLTAGFELMYYLAADGYKLDTPIFLFRIKPPGEYDGWETKLADGLHPEGRLTIAPQFRKYIAENVMFQFDGIEDDNGIIGEVINRVTGAKNETIHPNSLFEIDGLGLKIIGDEEHANDVGIYLESVTDGSRVKINPSDIATNEPKQLIAIAPGADYIPVGTMWYVVISTQSSTKRGGSSRPLKDVREIKSEFIITSE